jgi:hypothetical protein
MNSNVIEDLLFRNSTVLECGGFLGLLIFIGHSMLVAVELWPSEIRLYLSNDYHGKL